MKSDAAAPTFCAQPMEVPRLVVPAGGGSAAGAALGITLGANPCNAAALVFTRLAASVAPYESALVSRFCTSVW